MVLEIGYVHLYTGNGKGKTTAALGLAVRAAGAGLRVYVAQFAKGTVTSELKSLKKLSDCITIRQFGLPSFVKRCPSESDRAHAAKGMAAVRKAVAGRSYDMVILDEICGACRHALIPVEDVLAVIKKKPPSMEVVLTGRDAPEQFLKIADIVTEMKEVKHYFVRKVNARKGIEY